MWNHPIKRFASSTFVAGALLATALASHAQATPCKAACFKQFRDGAQACVVEGNCSRTFSTCRTNCIHKNMPGPDLSDCLIGCRSDRQSCRQDVANCKGDNLDTYRNCKDACDGQ